MFDARTKSLIGAPISRAIQPASTLPKLPVGTHERRRLGERLRRNDVVDGLGHHPRPVDRVDRRQIVAIAEGGVVEHRLDEILAIVERSLDGDGVHVRRVDRGHLSALDVAGASERIQDHDVDVVAARHTVDRRRPGVAAGGADDRDPLAALREDVVEHPADELQCNVLERQCRPVEELLHPLVGADLDQRDHCRMAEGGVRLGAEVGQGHFIDVGADEWQHHLDGSLDVVVAPPTARRECRP